MSSVRHRLLAVVLVLAVAGAIGTLGTFASAQVQLADERAMAAASTGGMEAAAELAAAVSEESATLDAFLLNRDPASLAAHLAAADATDRALANVATWGAATPDAAGAIRDIASRIEAWRSSHDEPSRASGAGASGPAPGRALDAPAAWEAVRTQLVVLHRALGEPSTAARQRAESIELARAMALAVSLAALALITVVVARSVGRWITGPLRSLLLTAKQVAAGGEGQFDSATDDEIGQLAIELAGMHESLIRQRIASDVGRFAVEDRAARDGVLNRFIELADFLGTDQEVAAATLEALDSLAAPEAAVVHLYNASRDRAIPLAARGDIAAAVLGLHSFDACPGTRRSSVFVNEDVALTLSIRCPVIAPTTGRLACVPLVALGETVGVIHAWWSERGALPAEPWAAAQRLVQQAALAIANRRMLVQLQSMADTDARTNLPNNRAFDRLLERAFEQRAADETFAVLLLDIDHFKQVNDRFGHPAGDEALKTFAGIVRSSLRDDDVAARYGGEEFTVFLSRADEAAAALVAERIRARVEASQIVLGPGVSTTITCSIGYAAVPAHAADRSEVLHAADRAVYAAKAAGRNRVIGAGGVVADPPATGAKDESSAAA